MCTLALVLALAAGTGVYTAPATTWSDLQKGLPKAGTNDGGKRVQQLLRFARDTAASLDDRQRATAALQAEVAAGDARRFDVDMTVAHVAAVAGQDSRRRDALARARAGAKRHNLDGKAAQLDLVLKGEDAAKQLADAVKRRLRSTPPAAERATDAALVPVVEAALPALLALGDERAHGALRLVLARRAALTTDDKGNPAPNAAADAIRAIGDIVDALAASKDARDSAAVRAEAWSTSARLQEDAGQWEDAAASALAADRARREDPHADAHAPDAPYTRSLETSALCQRLRAKGVDCGKLEMKRWGAHTFYDFSRDKSGAFNNTRVELVLSDYDVLIRECLAQGAKANLTTQTHVELEWSIGNDGRVPKDFDLRPVRLKKTVVDTCLAEAFAFFRYPPYRGEMQHVRLSWDVGE